MGTRADFYIGRGKSAQWIGSIAWDGYPQGINDELLAAVTEDEFCAEFSKFVAGRNDFTRPEDGWPWPWDNSKTTDFSYAFDNGKTWISCFGNRWISAEEWDPDLTLNGPKVEFPDMSNRKAVTLGKRSGLIVIEARQ